jgi:ComF family protein
VSQDSAVCKKCRADSRLKFVWARGQYGDVTKTLIYQLKFGRKKAAARVIARLLDESVPFLPKDTLITYVPTATSRVRVRGYDQSRLIAKELSKLRGLTMSPLLVRLGQTRQVGATRKQRIKQASNNYRLTNKRVTGQNIVIIDDILTTGATVEAAAKLLKQAGAKQVNAAVFAQK